MAKPRKVAKKRNKSAQKPGKEPVSSLSVSTKTAQQSASSHDAGRFMDNMMIASQLWQQICQKLSLGYLKDPALSVGHSDPFHIQSSLMRVASKFAENPGQLFQAQASFWKDHLELWHQTTHAMLGKAQFNPMDITDRRFKDEAWTDNCYFDYMRRSYLLSSRWLSETVQRTPGLDEHTIRKVEFFTRQFLDAISPSNFLMTNPEVMKLTLESNAENLVKGLQNMLEDIARGDGKLKISMTNEEAFNLGENIAATKGQVVYENDLIQLIQYQPTSEKVFATPLLITPAWINKYYVLDLRAQNSLVKWLVDQGYTVFMISWVNPDEEQSSKRFDDYLGDGPLAALDVIETITGCKQVNLLGYCLGGTLTSILLSYLRSHKQAHRVGSVTYLTTMVDFADAGDLSIFIDDEQLDRLEGRMQGKGYLDGADMATTFSMLRSNDLIWSFVVNNYLLGKEPFPFDLLYWNSDTTRMPAAMHSFYLRKMYQQNQLVKPAGIELLGTPINITKIETPSYILSTKDDHIAPWKSTYLATQIYDGPITFVLAQSGHIAGVVNPPSKGKYGFWANDELPAHAQDWLNGASLQEGESWWTHWHKWQLQYAGRRIKPPALGGKHYPPLEPAPGAYVRLKP